MKLSKSTKEIVVAKAVKQAFDEKTKASQESLNRAVFDWMIRNGTKRAKDIPEGFEKYITTTTSWCIYHPDRSNMHGNFNETLCDSRDSYVMLHDDAMKQLPEYAALNRLVDDKEAFTSAVWAVINSCTTDTQLGDTAPELARLLPEPPENVGGALVAVETVAKVRAILAGNQ